MATPRVTIPELPPVDALDDADLIVVQNGETTKRMTIGTITVPHRTALADHLNDASDAHDASAISASPNPVPMDGTNVQLQLGQAAAELVTSIATTAGLAAHLADTTDAHDASAISVEPLPGRIGLDVQAILTELSTIVGDGEMIEVGSVPPPDTEWLWADTTAAGEGGSGGGSGGGSATSIFNVRDWGAAGDGVADDTVSIQAALDAAVGGVCYFPEGTYLVSRPVIVKSNTIVRGVGAGSLLRNTQVDVLASQIFMVGHYHPNALTVWDRDTLAVPIPGAKTVTRTSTTLAIAKGDLVYVNVTGQVGNGQFLRRVEAVSGNDVTLHIPVSDFTGGTGATISKGIGYNPSLGGTVYPSYLSERVTIENLAVDTPNGYWICRTATLDSTFRNIDVRNSGALIYGNAFQNTVWDSIRGCYRTRCIEMADGSTDNHVSNIVGTWVTGYGYEAADAVVQLGFRTTLDGFDISDTATRTGGIFKLGYHGQSILNGRLRFGVVGTNVFQFGNGNDCTVSNVQIDAAGQIQSDVIRLLDCQNCTVRNVRVNSIGGYAASTYTIRQRTGCVNNVVDGVADQNISIIYQGVAEFLPASHRYSNISNIPGDINHVGTKVGFYGTTPVVKPTGVTPRVALETLGLGISLTDTAGNHYAEYPPATKAIGTMWFMPSMAHSAIWSGFSWKPVTPNLLDTNVCCILGNFEYLYDAEQWSVAGAPATLANLGKSAGGSMTQTSVTVGTDALGKKYMAYDGVVSFSDAGIQTEWAIPPGVGVSVIAIAKTAPTGQLDKQIYGNRGNLNAATSVGLALYLNSTGLYASRTTDGVVNPAAAAASVTAGVNVDLLMSRRDPVGDHFQIWVNGALGGTAVDNSTGTFGSSFATRIGRVSSSSVVYGQMNGYVFGFVKRALTDAEHTLLNTWRTNRLLTTVINP